jgi:diacylglycerol kinase family enzyme
MGGPSGVAPAAGPDDLAWDVPAGWTTAPNPNPMRKATFKIPKAGGEAEDAELAVSAASGGVEPNVKRWEQQFGDAKAKTEPRTVNGLKVTIVEIKGKFAGGGMMGAPAAPKDNQMLLGAIVDSGDRQHFFKMVGGEKTVTASRKDFDKLVSSLRAK